MDCEPEGTGGRFSKTIDESVDADEPVGARAGRPADDGSGVEPGSVLTWSVAVAGFAGNGIARRNFRGARGVAEKDAGNAATVCGDSGGAAGDQRNQGSNCGHAVEDPGAERTSAGRT